MIDLTCRLCAGSGVYDFSPSKETCGMCVSVNGVPY